MINSMVRQCCVSRERKRCWYKSAMNMDEVTGCNLITKGRKVCQAKPATEIIALNVLASGAQQSGSACMDMVVGVEKALQAMSKAGCLIRKK